MKLPLIILCTFLSLNTQSQEPQYVLREVLTTKLSNEHPELHFSMLGEISKKDIRIAIFWPCIINGHFIDNDIMGYAFTKKNNKWVFKEELALSLENATQEIIKVIGSTDFELTKPKGLEIDTIPSFIYKNANNIKNSLKSGNNALTAKLIENLSAAFSIDLCGYDNTYANLIIKESLTSEQMIFSKAVISKNIATVNVLPPMASKITLVKAESGWAIHTIQ